MASMISELVWRAVVTSESLAAVLADLEKRGPMDSAREGRALIRPSIKRHFGHLSPQERERTEWVISNAWVHTVTARSARRPDVLGLTCDLLANPEVTLTRDVTRFAVTLGLRSLYGVDYNAVTLQQLREAHTSLSARFEHQQRARIRKAEPLESFIIDLACLDGSMSRSLTRKNLRVYYSGFLKAPFGITKRMRQYAPEQDWPELHGTVPDFASITKLAFAQPTCIAGMDDVVQGLLAAVPGDDSPTNSGGLVTLIAGPPGSGKTSLCLTLAARMAELGAIVSYVATEEAPHALEAKLVSFVDPNYLVSALLPHEALTNGANQDALEFLDGRELDSFVSAVDALTKELDAARPQLPTVPEVGLYLTFPRVLVIDSLTALMHVTDDKGTRRIDRHSLASLLSRLRDRGICVFLVGGPSDCTDEGLAYLVDNVFLLDSEERFEVAHRIRLFDVYKTRLQSAYRGRHVLHLSRNEGCTINPSLHSLARHLHGHTESGGGRTGESTRIDHRAMRTRLPSREASQVLVYGHGSAGKARFALSLGLSTRVPFEQYPLNKRSSLDQDARVLVVSFLYGRHYYEQIAQGLFASRKVSAMRDGGPLTVLDLYPGFLDPETLVARIARILQQGRLEGRRYTSVIVDGVHNILVQFPLLQKEPLLWPTLYRVFRSEGVDAVSTFTFFRVPTIDGSSIEMVTDSQRLFAHLLVSNCDYSFIVERSQQTHDLLEVRLASAPSPTADMSSTFRWNPDRFEFVK